ncbi:glycosyltransferase [Leptobacterium flavescens]|uniref:Glycosyltransferase n=1 Tax=Leptobacterium flavescens TaxID=472055 RepID=A0A6P0UJV0_9FLAO|nr:glycosyltransferase [Leptobacterium flavescens]NER13247.1 glycosyltransferase [Leptobacterium flavescens]
MSQKEIGIDAFAITVPFLPNMSGKEIEVIDGIKYYRTNINNRVKNEISDQQKNTLKRINKFFAIGKFIPNVYRLCKREKPDVIHAHAMFFCGIPALIVGRILKIPVFYEVRSLWMLPKDNIYGTFSRKILAKIALKIELMTMRFSKKVFVINENLKDTLINLGIRDDKLIIISNAVNTSLIDQNIKKQERSVVRKKTVFGYIGSITHYEGIPFFIKALKCLKKERDDFQMIIYGSIRDEREMKLIEKSISEFALEEIVFFKGQIAPSEVYRAYSEIDVIVNPRLKNKITDTVTPLKPLEAMAYKKIFVGSDVGGIKDLLNDNDDCFLFESESTESLIKILKEVIDLTDSRKEEILDRARKHIIDNKSWIQNAYKYKKVYLSSIKN